MRGCFKNYVLYSRKVITKEEKQITLLVSDNCVSGKPRCLYFKVKGSIPTVGFSVSLEDLERNNISSFGLVNPDLKSAA